ncbi:hypothetical protein BC828DRAFT_400685 [Blastocladiella britannica]|nr:hypothetical protein BC828DRAFT_400685 [Blastocladiella britannica]
MPSFHSVRAVRTAMPHPQVGDERQVTVVQTERREIIIQKHFEANIRIVKIQDGQGMLEVMPEQSKQMLEPHPARALAAEHDAKIVIVPVGFWADETSGNTSKKYNLYETAGYKMANVDGALGRLLHNAQFIAAAKGVTCLDIGEAVVADANRELTNGVLWVDPNGKKVVLVARFAYIMGDGPKLSLMASHKHRHTNNCRECLHNKSTEKGDELVSVLRVNMTTWAAIKQQADCSAEVAQIQADPDKTDAQKTKATNAAIKKYDQATHGISAGFNPFLALPRLDLHRDTVTNNLHVGPLGHNKYLWEYTTLLKLGLVKNADAVTAFMCTIDRSSHKVLPTAGAITHHYRSMAGSEFRTLAQIMPFLLESVIPTASPARAAKDVDGIESHQERRQLLIDLALDTAILNKLLYQSSIVDKEDYVQHVHAITTPLYTLVRGNDVL